MPPGFFFIFFPTVPLVKQKSVLKQRGCCPTRKSSPRWNARHNRSKRTSRLSSLARAGTWLVEYSLTPFLQSGMLYLSIYISFRESAQVSRRRPTEHNKDRLLLLACRRRHRQHTETRLGSSLLRQKHLLHASTESSPEQRTHTTDSDNASNNTDNTYCCCCCNNHHTNNQAFVRRHRQVVFIIQTCAAHGGL